MSLYAIMSSSGPLPLCYGRGDVAASELIRREADYRMKFADLAISFLQIFANPLTSCSMREKICGLANLQINPCKSILHGFARLAVMAYRRSGDRRHVQKTACGDARGDDMDAVAHPHQDRPDLKPARLHLEDIAHARGRIG